MSCTGTVRSPSDGTRLWLCYCYKCTTHDPMNCTHAAVYGTKFCECCAPQSAPLVVHVVVPQVILHLKDYTTGTL